MLSNNSSLWLLIIKSNLTYGEKTGTLVPNISNELKRAIGINKMKTTVVTKMLPRINLSLLGKTFPVSFSM